MDLGQMLGVHESWIYSIIGACAIGLSGIFPLLIIPLESGPSLKHGAASSTLRLLLSFAVGSLLGDVFLHLLPEAWKHLHAGGHHDVAHNQMTVGLWVLAGIFTFVVVEVIFSREYKQEPEKTPGAVEQKESPVLNGYGPHSENGDMRIRTAHEVTSVANGSARHSNSHDHEAETVTEEHCTKDITGYLNLLANSIDNFTHGLAVAGSFLVSFKVGALTTFAILIHEVPHEIGDFAILLKSGFNRWEAAKAQMMTATVGLLGCIAALSADSTQSIGDRTLWILPFTAGGFLNIALVNVLPDLLKEKDVRESVKQMGCLVAGVTVMACVTLCCE